LSGGDVGLAEEEALAWLDSMLPFGDADVTGPE
jgi:hypothetical protein